MKSDSGYISIIAMKGHPFTRKTQFANQIATFLKCPVLSLHDFLDVLSPDYFQTSPSSSNCASQSLQPQDLAFRIICQIAKTHLYNQVAENIVIDSSLSSRSHLDQLIELAESLGSTKLVIVECKPENTVWRSRVEEFLENYPDVTLKWYKSKNWEDVEKAIRKCYDERSDRYKVSKLVLDPFSDHIDPESPFFHDAIRYMIKRNECDGPDIVEYHLWRHGQYHIPPGRACSGHYFTNYTEEGLEYEAMCGACENQVMGAAYTCKHCSFALHKECAELIDDNNKQLLECPPSDNLDFLLNLGYELCFAQDSCRCSSCGEKDNLDDSDSSPCGNCLFTTHLKKKVLPTIIRHDCDEHFLSIMMEDLNPKDKLCQCKACGCLLDRIWYSCRICGVDYDYKCLTEMPVRVEQEHGGHHHHMLLQYLNPEAEDYLCDVCFGREDPETRDPKRWFYSCEECVYVAHLQCVSDDRSTLEEDNISDEAVSNGDDTAQSEPTARSARPVRDRRRPVCFKDCY